jgi:tetratricopeptide (TPR) repeat protein
VPDDLAGAVETRIGKLPADTVTLLEAAAVCGVEFRAGTVAEVLGRPLPEVMGSCDQLVKKQYWLRHVAAIDLRDGSLDSLYSFRHAIYRHVFYQRIGAAPRVQLHRRVAQALSAGVALGVSIAPAELASHHERGREPATALRAYSLAAQSALRAFAPAQAVEICEHARTLFDLVPPGPERMALELAIESPRGVATSQIHGVGSLEARAIWERVRELFEALPQHPARALLVNGYGALLFSRGEYAKLWALADRFDQLDGPDRAPLLVMTALFRAGAASGRGQCRLATEWWQKAIAYCEAIKDRSGFQAFIIDPEAGIRANSVRTFFERGLFDEARRQAEIAIAQGEALGHPLTQTLARWRAGMLEVRLCNPHKVIEHANAIEIIVNKTSVTQGDGPSRYLRGWAMAQLGDPKGGLERIRDGLARHLRVGMISSSTEVMGYAAEALVLASDWATAEQELDAAFAQVRTLDENAYVPMLLMLRARVAQGRGDAAGAYRFLQEAVGMARTQEAPGFELKAACALVEHPASTAADREELAQLVASFTEGLDTPDVVRARRLATAANRQ